MICPKCGYEQEDGGSECPRCGIVFEKHREIGKAAPASGTCGAHGSEIPPERGLFLRRLLFEVPLETKPFHLAARVLLLLVLLLWGLRFSLASADSPAPVGTFMHFVNLPFHEAGHILFRPLGTFMASLGGSLTQLLVPLACLTAFLFVRRNTFGAATCLWWFGQNFVDLAPYISDAGKGLLPLLGGNTGRDAPYGFHDWEFILTETGLLHHDAAIGAFSFKAGLLLMALSLGWGGFLLWRQYQNLTVQRFR